MSTILALKLGPITPIPPAPIPLSAPAIVVTPNGTGTANAVSWTAQTNAFQYQVQKATVPNAITAPTDWTADDETFDNATLSWNDGGIGAGVYRYYRIRTIADPGQTTYATSDWTVSSIVFTAASSSSARPAMTSFSKNIINRPDVAPYNLTGGEQPGAVTFWVNNTGNTSSETAVAGHAGHFYGTWRGARDHAESLPTSTPIIVYAITSGRINETGFFWWRKSNATINFATAPSPGLFFGQGMQLAVYQCSNVIFKHVDCSMDNNVTAAEMDNRDCLYVGDCSTVVFQNCTFRQCCDELTDFVDHNNVGWVEFANCFKGPPLCNAGRLADKFSHGYVGVGGYGAKRVRDTECFCPHNNGRAYVLFRGTDYVGNDNLVYNCGYQVGDPTPFSGMVEIGSDRPSDSTGATPIFQNHRGNLFIPGPNPITTGAKPYNLYGDIPGTDAGPINSASRICITNNYYYDPLGRMTWAQNTASNFVTQTGTGLAGVLTTTVNASIEPVGYTVWTLTLVSNQVTQADALAKATYITSNAGAYPGDRTAGPDALFVSHCLNWIQQNGGPYGRLYNDESEILGNFTVPTNTMSIAQLLDPTSWSGDGFPFAGAEGLLASNDGQMRTSRSQWTLRREQGKGCRVYGQAA